MLPSCNGKCLNFIRVKLEAVSFELQIRMFSLTFFRLRKIKNTKNYDIELMFQRKKIPT